MCTVGSMPELLRKPKCMGVLIGIACVVWWIIALSNWDGEKHCDEDCSSCPFPPCEKRKENNDEKGNVQKMD